MSHLRTGLVLILFSFCFSSSAAAWGTESPTEPSHLELAADYSYVRGDAANGDGLNLNGADVSLAFRLDGPLSLVGDVGANRTGNVTGTGLSVTVSTFMAGPRLSLKTLARFHPCIQVLAGAARASGSVFSTIGNTTGFAAAPGLRLDYSLGHRISLRLLEADYRFSTYRQNDRDHEKSVRLGAGIVAHF